MATTTFDTVILAFGDNTGIEVPADDLAALGGGRRPRVLVTIGEYSYDSTVGVMGGRSLISLSKAHRDATGLTAGAAVTVTLTVQSEPRDIEVPAPLASALNDAGLSDRFAQLAYSRRKEFVRQVAEAKTDATRDRRIAKVLDAMR